MGDFLNSTKGKENHVGLFGARADSCGGETSHLPADDHSVAVRFPTPWSKGWMQTPAHLRATRKVFVSLI